jgi:hypothetical protein
MMWPPCPINYAWWAESNDTSLNFLAPREPSETPLPAGHQNVFQLKKTKKINAFFQIYFEKQTKSSEYFFIYYSIA